MVIGELNLRLFDDKERNEYFVKANYHELLKADSAAKNLIYANGRQWGWLTANEIRDREDLNDIGPEG